MKLSFTNTQKMGRNNAQGKRILGIKHGEINKDFWHLVKREREMPTEYESEHESLAES